MFRNTSLQADYPFSLYTYLSLFDNMSPAFVNEAAYNASFMTFVGENPLIDPIIYDKSWRKGALNFSYTERLGYASMISINFRDDRQQVNTLCIY